MAGGDSPISPQLVQPPDGESPAADVGPVSPPLPGTAGVARAVRGCWRGGAGPICQVALHTQAEINPSYSLSASRY